MAAVRPTVSKRGREVRGIHGAVLVSMMSIGLSACVTAPTGPTPTARASATPVGTLPSPTRDSSTVSPTIAPTESPAATSSPNAASGTRENPFALRTEFPLPDWLVRVDSVELDAWPQIRDENQFNDPPADGRQFVMFHVTVTYTGTETGHPAFGLSWSIVGSRGNTFGTSMDDSCGVIPDALSDEGELFSGAVAEGNRCVSVASDQVDGATIQVRQFLSGDPVFVALQ